MARKVVAAICVSGIHTLATDEAFGASADPHTLVNTSNAVLDPLGCVDLNSGYAITTSDVNKWPCVKVSRGAGTLNHIPRFPNLLGKLLKVTVDLSAVGCRWNLAFQMVDSLANGGNYCDGQSANPCVEVDFMEANEHVWGTTLHAGSVQGGWKGGYAKGFGGDRQGMWNYGRNSGNVNTKHPIDLNIGFPTDSAGNLKYLFIGLYQDGDTHPKATMTLNGGGMAEVSKAIRRGMLPGFSLWHVGATNWFDGPNCNYDYPSNPAFFSNWQLVDDLGSLASDSEIVV